MGVGWLVGVKSLKTDCLLSLEVGIGSARDVDDVVFEVCGMGHPSLWSILQNTQFLIYHVNLLPRFTHHQSSNRIFLTITQRSNFLAATLLASQTTTMRSSIVLIATGLTSVLAVVSFLSFPNALRV